MRSLIAILAAACLLPFLCGWPSTSLGGGGTGGGTGGGGSPSFTFVGSASGISDGDTTTVSTSSPITGIEDGDLIIGAVQWEDTDTTVSSFVDDGSVNTLTFTTGDDVHSASNEINLYPFALTSATARTSATFTATLSASRQYKKITVIVFRPSGGSASRDVSGTREANGDSASIVTGSFSTAGANGVACGVAGIYTGGSWSAQTVAGVSADHSISPGGQTIWCRLLSSALTTQTAASTYSSIRFWAATVMAYKVE